MSRFRRAALVASPVALVLALAGCSADGEGELDYADSPLSTYFSAIYGGDLSPEEQEERMRVQQTKTEELVAACMSDEGFEYIPNVQSGAMISVTDDGDNVWDPESEEWVSQWGYGMVNWPGRDEPVDPGEVYVDPNQEYIESLSPSEQQAYSDTLWGAQPTEEELNDDGSYEYDWKKAGCYGAAQHEVSGDDPTQNDEFAGLMESINEFYQNTQESPEYLAIDRKWAECMADAGHAGFTRQYDAQNSISERLNELYNNPDGEVDQAAMDALGKEEIEVALADLKCRKAVDYRQEQMKVQFSLEEQFVTDHKSELEALKAAAEQAS